MRAAIVLVVLLAGCVTQHSDKPWTLKNLSEAISQEGPP